jgi:hypothetical protein
MGLFKFYKVSWSSHKCNLGAVTDENIGISLFGIENSGLLRLFLSTMDLFCLVPLKKLVVIHLIYTFVLKPRMERALSAAPIFGCGCAHIFSCPQLSFFLLHHTFLAPHLVRWINGLYRGYKGFKPEFKNIFSIVLYLIICDN